MSKNHLLNALCGSAIMQDENALTLRDASPLAPFDRRVITFLSDLSGMLLKDREAKAYPDVVTFAFFCRRANVLKMKESYADIAGGTIGRGYVFHIAPSNVPINFAYSLVSALLAGNQSVVKASSQDFMQTRIVCRAMSELLTGMHAALAPYINVVTYSRDRQDITEMLSAACHVRVIWGGDETIKRIRQASIPAHAFDVTFADRYSVLAIEAKAILGMEEKQLAQTALGFYNDTYLTDQNACTSPRLIYWVGDGQVIEMAKQRFWSAVHEYAAPRYEIEPVIAVDKLTAAYRAAIELGGTHIVQGADNLIARVSLDELPKNVEEYRCAGGFFIEYGDDTLDALTQVVTRKYQTLSYIGFEPKDLQAFVRENGLLGIDRITPVGKTMDFLFIWDGYDLIRTFSRHISAL
ncbi:MAG: acyl-CoA reductase [Clostridiales bacterium]|nr:acyl-CoA reductase [Clostridiales bacterium]